MREWGRRLVPYLISAGELGQDYQISAGELGRRAGELGRRAGELGRAGEL